MLVAETRRSTFCLRSLCPPTTSIKVGDADDVSDDAVYANAIALTVKSRRRKSASILSAAHTCYIADKWRGGGGYKDQPCHVARFV